MTDLSGSPGLCSVLKHETPTFLGSLNVDLLFSLIIISRVRREEDGMGGQAGAMSEKNHSTLLKRDIGMAPWLPLAGRGADQAPGGLVMGADVPLQASSSPCHFWLLRSGWGQF